MTVDFSLLIRTYLASIFAKNVKTQAHFGQWLRTTASKPLPWTASTTNYFESVGRSNVSNVHVWCVGCNGLVDDNCDVYGALAEFSGKGQVTVVCSLEFVGELVGVFNGEIDTAGFVTISVVVNCELNTSEVVTVSCSI